MASTPFSLYEAEQKAKLTKIPIDPKDQISPHFIEHLYSVEHPNLPQKVYVNARIHSSTPDTAIVDVIGKKEDYNKVGTVETRKISKQIAQDLGINFFAAKRIGGARTDNPKWTKIKIRESEEHFKKASITKIGKQEKTFDGAPYTSHTYEIRHPNFSRPVTVFADQWKSNPKVAEIEAYGDHEDNYNKLGTVEARRIARHIAADTGATHFDGIRMGGARAASGKPGYTKIRIRESTNQKAELEKVKVETYRTPHGEFVSHHYTLYHPALPRLAKVIATIPYYDKKIADINIIGNHEDYNKVGVANIRNLKRQIMSDLKVDAVSGVRTGGARIKLGSGPKRVTIKEENDVKIVRTQFQHIDDRENSYHLFKYRVFTPKRNFVISGWKHEKDNIAHISDISGKIGMNSGDYNTVGAPTIRHISNHIKSDLGITHLSGNRVGGARRGPARDTSKRYEQTVVKLRERVKDDDIYHTQDLEEFSQHLIDKHGAHVELYRTPEGHVNLQTLIVPKELRNQGIASNVIKDIKRYSNKNKVKIILNAVPLDNSTKSEQLIDFYKSHGFVENKGRHKDYRIAGQDTMYRNHKEAGKKK